MTEVSQTSGAPNPINDAQALLAERHARLLGHRRITSRLAARETSGACPDKQPKKWI
jgi:hypothetical protein